MQRAVILFVAIGLVAALAPADDPKPVPGLRVDAAKKTVTIDARVAPRKLAHLPEVYPIEVIATFPFKEGVKGKAHETVLTTDVKPSEVHRALESLGLKPGKPARGEGAKADGPEVNVFIEVPQPGGTARRLTLDRLLIDPKTRKPMPRGVKYRFTGSAMTQPDPNSPARVYGADITGTLIALFPVTDETVLQTSLTMAEEKYLKLDVNRDVLPKEGEPVKLVLEVPGK